MAQSQSADSNDASDTATETPVDELLEQCETPGDVRSLDGRVINEEPIEGGDRVRVTQISIEEAAERVTTLEGGDALAFIKDGLWKIEDILDIGDNVAGPHGQHVKLDAQDDPRTCHLSLIYRWMSEDRLVAIRVFEHEYAAHWERTDNGGDA